MVLHRQQITNDPQEKDQQQLHNQLKVWDLQESKEQNCEISINESDVTIIHFHIYCRSHWTNYDKYSQNGDVLPHIGQIMWIVCS